MDHGHRAELFLGLSGTAWQGIGSIAACATVLVAVVAAIFVAAQISQARQLSEDEARPYVVAFLDYSPATWRIFDFVVQNFGQTVAHDIRISFDRPYVRSNELAGNEFMKAHFIESGLPTLVPGQRVQSFLDSGPELLDAGRTAPDPYKVTVRYRDRRGRPLADSFTIDTSTMLGTVRTDVHGIHHIASTLRAWAKSSGTTSF